MIQRILVTGSPGAGKSTVSRLIAERTGLPWFGLDDIVWQPGWQKTPKTEEEAKIARVVTQDRWVLDGISRHALREADMIIFLDVPRPVAFWRAGKRTLRYLRGGRPGVPPGSPELKIIPVLIAMIWRFPGGSAYQAILEQQRRRREDGSFQHVRSARQLNRLLDNLS